MVNLGSVELRNNHVDLVLAGVPAADTERQIRQHEADLNEWGPARKFGVRL